MHVFLADVRQACALETKRLFLSARTYVWIDKAILSDMKHFLLCGGECVGYCLHKSPRALLKSKVKTTKLQITEWKFENPGQF